MKIKWIFLFAVIPLTLIVDLALDGCTQDILYADNLYCGEEGRKQALEMGIIWILLVSIFFYRFRKNISEKPEDSKT